MSYSYYLADYVTPPAQRTGTLTKAIIFGVIAAGAASAGASEVYQMWRHQRGVGWPVRSYGHRLTRLDYHHRTARVGFVPGLTALGLTLPNINGALSRQIVFGKTIAALNEIHGSVTKAIPFGRTIAGTNATTGSVVRAIPFTLLAQGSSSPTATFSRQITFGSTIQGALALTGTLSKQIVFGRTAIAESERLGSLTREIAFGRSVAGALETHGTLARAIIFTSAAIGSTSTIASVVAQIPFGHTITGALANTGATTRGMVFGRSVSGILEIQGALTRPIPFQTQLTGSFPNNAVLTKQIVFGRVIIGANPAGQQLAITFTDTSATAFSFALGTEPVVTTSTMYLWTSEDQEPEVTAVKKSATGTLIPATGLTGITLSISASKGGAAIGGLSWSAVERGMTGIYYALADTTTLSTNLPEATYPDGTTVYLVLTKAGDVAARSWRKIVRRQREGDG